MSVVILGMEMPENCGECRLMVDYWCYAKQANGQPGPTFMEKRPDWCPLRPLPEKHGRLIDAEVLEHTIGKLSLSWEYGQGVSDCWDALIDSPTIVEAEEE